MIDGRPDLGLGVVAYLPQNDATRFQSEPHSHDGEVRARGEPIGLKVIPFRLDAMDRTHSLQSRAALLDGVAGGLEFRGGVLRVPRGSGGDP